MARTISSVMTTDPVTCPADAPLTEAAKCMKTADIGDVVVMDNGTPCGIVTDRDIVVRAIADGKDPSATPLRDVCSSELQTVVPNDPLQKAVELMRNKAIRRLPVMENGKVVGIVSIGDLAVESDGESALADISKAPASR